MKSSTMVQEDRSAMSVARACWEVARRDDVREAWEEARPGDTRRTLALWTICEAQRQNSTAAYGALADLDGRLTTAADHLRRWQRGAQLVRVRFERERAVASLLAARSALRATLSARRDDIAEVDAAADSCARYAAEAAGKPRDVVYREIAEIASCGGCKPDHEPDREAEKAGPVARLLRALAREDRDAAEHIVLRAIGEVGTDTNSEWIDWAAEWRDGIDRTLPASERVLDDAIARQCRVFHHVGHGPIIRAAVLAVLFESLAGRKEEVR